MSGYELSVLGDGSERANLQSPAIGLNFQFCGPDANIPGYYRYADIFIAPSIGPEVLHSATVEAMSHGLPCILSDLPAYKELSNNGAAAMLFKCGDSAALRSCLHTLLSSESERRRYGMAAYETIVNKHVQMSLVPLISASSDCASLR